MANDLYKKVMATVIPYIGEEKAARALGRQLRRCAASPDTVTEQNLRTVMDFLIGATSLYLHPDKEKQAQLAHKLKGLVL